MIRKALLLGIFSLLKVNAVKMDSNELLNMANQRISNELMLVDPFWTNTMIPVAVCLAVVLLIVSIFAVSLIAIKALNDPEPAFSSFAPPGFDALWERNIQAELGMNYTRKSELETILEENEENEIMVQVSKPVKLPDVLISKPTKFQKDKIPMDPPKPLLATNSKSGLEVNI